MYQTPDYCSSILNFLNDNRRSEGGTQAAIVYILLLLIYLFKSLFIIVSLEICEGALGGNRTHI
jgi:hypothetical protein